MALKVVVKSLDEVPEAFHSLYTQVGDEFVLDTDDGGFKSKLSEFRNNNIDLKKQLESGGDSAEKLKAALDQLNKFGDMDAEAAAKALETVQALSDQKLIDAGKLDELMADRTERMRINFENQLTAALEARDSATAQSESDRAALSAVTVDNGLTDAITTVGKLQKGALQDALSRGRQVWRLNETGVPTPFKAGTNDIMFGKDGENPVSMEEWAQGLMNEAGYLYEGNSGGNANGNLSNNGQQGVVSAGDQAALSNNLEGLANGTVTVI